MKTTITLTIGRNRGKARLWIEGKILESQGWTKGMPFTACYRSGLVLFKVDLLGSRKVAGAAGRPIIDTNTDRLLEALGAEIGDKVEITLSSDRIEVRKA